jgi:ketosteroid isomerase-like protein
VARDTGEVSQENVHVVEDAIAALNERDLERYLSCCTEDVELRTPLAEIGGVYQGPDGIRRFFDDLGDTSPDFRIELDGLQEFGADRVVGFLRVSATGRASGIPAAVDTATTNVYDFADGKLSRVRIFLDRQEALEAASSR